MLRAPAVTSSKKDGAVMLENTPTPVLHRRKIPRSEWGAIVMRHASGESLVSIARDYNCTAPAIGYIVRQERRWDATPEAGEESDSRPPPSEQAAPRHRRSNVSDRFRTAISRPASQGSFSAGAERHHGFDTSLREAMTVEVSAFLVALDAMISQQSSETFSSLREATDRLLRAAARVRIELESCSAPPEEDPGKTADKPGA